MKKKILIIDDEWDDRKAIYINVLSEKFEILYIEDPSNLFIEISQKDVDCYLVDVVLENWKVNENKPQELMPVLFAIKGNNSPIFLVSRRYNTLIQKSELTPLLNEIIKQNISIESFFIWDDFEKEAFRRDRDTNVIFTDSIGSLLELKTLQLNEVLSQKEKRRADVGIICALRMELEPILDVLENKEKETVDNISYTRGIITTKSGRKIKVIAVQQEDMGTEDAAILGSILVKYSKINHLFMSGVCGGRDGKVKIGDVIIPHEVVAYQRGKYKDNILEFDVGSAKSNVNVSQIFGKECDDILKRIFKDFTRKKINEGKSLKIKVPKLHFNEMACGANVIDTERKLDKISVDVGKRKLCSVDMESFSIYRLNHFLDVKSVVIKSVMDLTSDKDDEYKEYAAYVSANFIHKTLKEEIYKI